MEKEWYGLILWIHIFKTTSYLGLHKSQVPGHDST
jgi:hypothetical protein